MPKEAHKVVVIGHRNPDTDSICSAIAYAELKNRTSTLVCEPRRAGKMNQETEFVLKKFGVTPPRMCTDVNPKIRDVDYREMPGIPGSTSLRRAWKIMRDQQIDTLSITSADNELEGIITVKDLATANMDVFDTAVLAKSRTSYKNILETLNGTIRSVSGADPAGDASLMTCTVTIAVPNAGSLTTAQAAVAQVNGVSSLNSAHFTYQREETVVAAASGTVSELCVKEGSTVRQDDVILRITGKDLDKQAQNAADNLRSAELRMSSAERNISHYTIDAPISGTIVDKKVKAGDKLSANDTAMQNLCTIYDMSYLEMKLNVDELKIRSLEVGQEVNITADAVPGETYKGVISSILVAGTTANGSTSYPVTVRIDDMGELLPGMNATAKITTASVKNVLALPNAALVRGSYVLVTKDSPSAANAETSMTAPDGYVYVKVTTGISDDDYIEVKSGLQEGDTIAYDNSSVSATDFYSNMMASAEGDDE